MTKRICILSDEKNSIIDALTEYFKHKDIEIIESSSLMEACECDLCILDGYKGHLKNEILSCTTFINLHRSLLPAFEGEKPVEKALEYGVKVTGITLHYITEEKFYGKIIAQYPIFIDVLTTAEELNKEMDNTARKLVPFVADSILKDIVFSFDILLKPEQCDGNCSGSCNCQNQPKI
ncbi:MAG: hypothetical protein KHX03_03990 [Clostridium sp.]|nr:hypothetical protein [Clostridium sp.]